MNSTARRGEIGLTMARMSYFIGGGVSKGKPITCAAS
jgi:hypothetical protein